VDVRFADEQTVRLAHARLAEEHARLVHQSMLLNCSPPYHNQWLQQQNQQLPPQHWCEAKNNASMSCSAHATDSGLVSDLTKQRISNRSSKHQTNKPSNGCHEVSPSPVSSAASEVSTTPGHSRAHSASLSPRQSAKDQPRTTLILRNLPMHYSRDLLLDLLDLEGFLGLYDLVYHPIDFGTKLGFGYAFVNFVSVEAALKCSEHFDGFTRWNILHKKACEVSQSTELQGLEAHIERYRNSPVMHESVPDEFKPATFRNGQRLPFPASTKKVSKPRAPRLRRQEMRVAKRVALDEER
jgi:hypothetical protein